MTKDKTRKKKAKIKPDMTAAPAPAQKGSR